MSRQCFSRQAKSSIVQKYIFLNSEHRNHIYNLHNSLKPTGHTFLMKQKKRPNTLSLSCIDTTISIKYKVSGYHWLRQFLLPWCPLRWIFRETSHHRLTIDKKNLNFSSVSSHLVPFLLIFGFIKSILSLFVRNYLKCWPFKISTVPVEKFYEC